MLPKYKTLFNIFPIKKHIDESLTHKWAYELIDFEPTSILDIGVGDGYNLYFLLNRFEKADACGITSSEKKIRNASKLNHEFIENKRLEIGLMDKFGLPYRDDNFDLVTIFKRKPTVEDLKEYYRVIKPNGYILLGGRKDNQFDPKINEYLEEAGFSDIEMAVEERKKRFAIKAKKTKL